jgi:subtilisin family serine protease
MKQASFSQYNDQVEIAGPGVNILSTYPPNGYKILSGTSMACPYVAGVAAEVWSHFPQCTNNQIRNVLLRTALDRGVEGYDIVYGHGIVQAKTAYDLLQSEGCVAGGDAAAATPAGGCLQNPDYTVEQCEIANAQPASSAATAVALSSLGSSSLFLCGAFIMWFFLTATI